MSDPKQITMKNGKPAVQGKCPVCATTMNKIGASLDGESKSKAAAAKPKTDTKAKSEAKPKATSKAGK